MTWRVLISAPYMLPVLEEFRPRLEGEGVEIVTLPVRERLDEAELLAVVPGLDGAICGDDQFTERVLSKGSRLKVISKWGTGTGDSYWSKITDSYKTFERSHWMPPRPDGLNQANWPTSKWAKAVDFMQKCTSWNPPAECEFVDIPRQ